MTWTNIVDTKKLLGIVTSQQVIVYDIKTSLKSNEPINFFVTSKIRLYIYWNIVKLEITFKFIYNFKKPNSRNKIAASRYFYSLNWGMQSLSGRYRKASHNFHDWRGIQTLMLHLQHLCQVILSLLSMIHEMHIKSF